MTSLRLASHSSGLFFYPRQEATTNHWSNCSCLLSITQINYSPLLSSHQRYIFSNKPNIWSLSEELPIWFHSTCIKRFRLHPHVCALARALVRVLKTKDARTGQGIEFNFNISFMSGEKHFFKVGIFAKEFSKVHTFQFSCVFFFLVGGIGFLLRVGYEIPRSELYPVICSESYDICHWF